MSDELPDRVRAVAAHLRAEAVEWCRDRSWEVRVPVLLYLAWVQVQNWRHLEGYSSWFAGLNLGVHEAGHLIFRPLGEYMTIAGGTLVQWLVPVVCAAALYKGQRDFFGVAFCLGWLSDSLFDSALYVSDARGQLNLPLVTFEGQGLSADLGGGDWTHLLEPLGLLRHDTKLAFLFKAAGSLLTFAALALGGWLCWTMQRLRGAPALPPPDWAKPRGGPIRPGGSE